MENTPIFKNGKFLFAIFSAFLSIFGIGIIIPVIPFIVQRYIPSHNIGDIAFHVGTLISTYAICQFFASPVLGALSDRFGRRPILLLCLAGSAIGYTMFGIGGSLLILYIARIIDGSTGGDISTIFAYVADITKPAERGKYYGMLGAVMGLGFMLGPTIGGLTSQINLSFPLFFAAGLTTLNIIFGLFVLPESLSKENRISDFSLHHLNPFVNIAHVLSKEKIRKLIYTGFFYFLPFAFMTGTTSLYFKDIMHWQPQNIGLVFFVLGLGDIFTQGYLSRRLIPKFGELKLLSFGFILTGIAFSIFSLLPLFPFVTMVFVYIVIYALGSGLFEPSFGAVVTQNAHADEQGRVQGAVQSMESITRIIGPLIATYFYGFIPSLPFILAAGFSFLGLTYLSRNISILKRIA